MRAAPVMPNLGKKRRLKDQMISKQGGLSCV